jgi:hypothetical protein
MELLHDQLLYKRAVLEQLLIVATIFGAFSVSGVIALLVAPTRDRLRTYIFLALCVASLAFIFATALDALLLPGMHRDPSGQTQREVRGLLDLGEAPIWGVLVGTLALIAALGGFGFAFSRRLGWIVLALSLATLVAFVASAIHLARLLP